MLNGTRYYCLLKIVWVFQGESIIKKGRSFDRPITHILILVE